MNRTDFINLIAENAGIPKYKAKMFYKTFIKTLMEVLESGEKVNLYGFGKFYIKERGEYVTTNPNNQKEKLTVPPRKKIRFDQGVCMKSRLNNKEEAKENE